MLVVCIVDIDNDVINVVGGIKERSIVCYIAGWTLGKVLQCCNRVYCGQTVSIAIGGCIILSCSYNSSGIGSSDVQSIGPGEALQYL